MNLPQLWLVHSSLIIEKPSSYFAISKTQAYVHEYGFHFKDFIVQLMYF